MEARPSSGGGARGGTSLKGLRQQMVAEAQAIADERRNRNQFNSVASQQSNLKSSVKPVIDGSVLRNDSKQKMVKERREEKRRQEDVNKESQLREKERKAKLQYEKQIEERHHKMKEQKDKDECKRISAEEKRRQKLAEEQAKFKAVVHRTLERSSRVGRQQKRWSWETSFPLDYDSKLGIMKNKRSSSLSRKDKLHSYDKKMECGPDSSTPVFRYVHVPLRRYSMEEWKSTSLLPTTEVKTPSQTALEATTQKKEETPPEESVEAPPEASSSEAPPESSAEVPLEDAPEMSPEAVKEAFRKANKGAPPQVTVEMLPRARGDAPPKVKVDTPAPSEHPVRAIQSLCPLGKKRPSSLAPCPRWPSSAPGWHLPFSQYTNREIHKTSPSPSPFTSKQSIQNSQVNKMTPDRRAQFSQNVLPSLPKKRETLKTTRKSEAVSKKHVVFQESDSKSTSETMNAEEATNILTEKRHLAREQKVRDEEERLQKEMEPSTAIKVKDLMKKTAEDQPQEVSKFDDKNLHKEIGNKKGSQKNSETLPQEEDIRVIAPEEAGNCKKEHERIMLQNLQERSERKKTAETSGNETCKEDEADDEDTTASGSDKDSSDSLFSPGRGFTKLKTIPRRLVFLKDSSEPIYTETNIYFNAEVSSVMPTNKNDHLAHGKRCRPSTKRASTCKPKTKKANETKSTSKCTPCLEPNQEKAGNTAAAPTHDGISESAITDIRSGSRAQNLMGSTTLSQNPEMSSDNKKKRNRDASDV
ncbi:MAP7 domain-containing protein 3 isoform X2 [Ochotona princeps]|uniref:MAP7 domain-containing protein 3 isoform X2 n=1 Tax=Ochotona princeps TaxID=9978 RepID=UPI0027151193|nr:MAP7 domain-containing protein 3 isoform X2 [Ochotona princeps]